MTENILDYSVIHHSALLCDTNRLMSFKKALKEIITPDSIVVDIGTGTGILAAYAAQLTPKSVYAIEYFEFAEQLAKKILQHSPLKNIKLIKDDSFNIELTESPDILVTETIGQIGPEENIVEICYDFCRKHPSIKQIIPMNLTLYAEFIDSDIGHAMINNLLHGYLNASSTDYDYSVIKSDIQKHLTHFIFQADLHDAKSRNVPIQLAKYELGKTACSTFHKTIVIPSELTSSLVHLYFVAHLTENTVLSSHFDHSNHWKHSFIALPPDAKHLTVSYLAGAAQIKVLYQH